MIVSRIMLFVLLCLPMFGRGQENKLIVEDFHKERIAFFADWWENPSLRFYYPFAQFTDVSLNGQWVDNEAYAVQQGDEENRFLFRANSFTRKEKQLYYGSATYENSLQKGLLWNTVADVERLQPYIVGDTVGGDMNKERFFFSGGYAKQFGKMALGAFASYKATKAYDRKDPRPKNTVSDLRITLGGAMPVFRNYALGVHASFQEYEQDHMLSIVREKGSATIFYLRGLGVDDKHFTTVTSDGLGNKYKQNIYTAGLSFYPLETRGFLAAMSFSNTELKLMSFYGINLKDVSRLMTNTGKAAVGYKFSIKELPYYVKFHGHYQQQRGTEYLYNRENMSIGTAKKYKNDAYEAGLSFEGSCQWSRLQSNYGLNAAYAYKEERYSGLRNTRSSKEVGNLAVTLHKNLLWQQQKGSLLVKLKGGYRHNLTKDLQTGSLTAETALETLVTPDYLWETANCISGGLTLRYDYYLSEKYSLYTKGDIAYAKFKEIGNNKNYLLSIGLTF